MCNKKFILMEEITTLPFKELDLPGIILYEMITEGDRENTMVSLLYDLMIMHILHSLDILYAPTKDFINPMGDINEATLKKMKI